MAIISYFTFQARVVFAPNTSIIELLLLNKSKLNSINSLCKKTTRTAVPLFDSRLLGIVWSTHYENSLAREQSSVVTERWTCLLLRIFLGNEEISKTIQYQSNLSPARENRLCKIIDKESSPLHKSELCILITLIDICCRNRIFS